MKMHIVVTLAALALMNGVCAGAEVQQPAGRPSSIPSPFPAWSRRSKPWPPSRAEHKSLAEVPPIQYIRKEIPRAKVPAVRGSYEENVLVPDTLNLEELAGLVVNHTNRHRLPRKRRRGFLPAGSSVRPAALLALRRQRPALAQIHGGAAAHAHDERVDAGVGSGQKVGPGDSQIDWSRRAVLPAAGWPAVRSPRPSARPIAARSAARSTSTAGGCSPCSGSITR